MAVVFREWLNANEGRAYPIHDSATLLSISGQQLPHNLLVDAHIQMPSVLGSNLYVSSVGLSASLVTVTFLALDYNPICTSGSLLFTPAAVVSIPKPVTRYKNYAITPLYPGVGGWVSFGSLVESDEALTLLFNDPKATLLLDRTVRVYTELPVTSIGKLYANSTLTGVIQLKGVQGVTKTAKSTRIVNEQEVPVVTVGMDVELNKVTLLQEFAGTCGHRPQVGTCKKTAISSINGVIPDAHGNINIEFSGDEIVTDTQDGLLLDYPIGLSQSCPKPPFKSRLDVPNTCENSSIEFSSSSLSSSSEEFSSQANSSIIFVPDYYSENFSDSVSEFTDVKGAMQIVDVISNNQINKRLVSLPGVIGQETYSIDFLRQASIPNLTNSFTLSGVIHPRSNSEGHLIFGYKSNKNFYFAGLALQGALEPDPSLQFGRFFIGRRSSVSGSSWPFSLGGGYNFLAGGLFTPPVPLDSVDYHLQIDVANIGAGTANINMLITWTDLNGTDHIAVHNVNTPFNTLGYLGFGTVDAGTDSVTEFDDIIIDT